MSGMSPRPPHPPPATAQVARVQPQVPELSLFFPGPGPRHHHRPGLGHPPQPHQLPTYHLQPQSDLSQQFHRTEATLFLNGSSDSNGRKVQWSDQQPQPSASKPSSSYPPPTAAFIPPSDQSPTPTSIPSSSHQTPVSHRIPFSVPPLHQTPARISKPPLTASNPDHEILHPPNNYTSPQATRPRQSREFSPQVAKLSPMPSSDLQQPANVHPDILAVLSWQNDQLTRLQDQVARLLAASPGQPESASVSTNTSNVWPQDIVEDGHQATHGHGKVDNGQNTSHGSDIYGHQPTNGSQEGVPTLNVSIGHNNIRQNSYGDIHGGDMDLESQVGSYRPVVHQTPVKTDQVSGVSWESPVLGESVSMYQREKEDHELIENILGRVKRLLADDTDNVENDKVDTKPIQEANISDDVKENKIEVVTEEPPRPDPTLATWDRLKQLGVSFISAGDLSPAGQLDTTAAGQPFNSIWLPQARLPSLSSSSPDTSLAINNLALKYLSDAELSKLAALHQRQDNKNKGMIMEFLLITLLHNCYLENVPRPTDLSMASQQFLAKYGLQSESVPSQSPQSPGPIRKQETPQQRILSTNQTPSQQNQCYSPAHYQTSPQSSVTNTRPPKAAKSQPMLSNGPQLYPRPSPVSYPHNGPVVGHHPNGPHPHQSNHPLPAPHPLNGPAVNQPFERLLDISAIRQQSKLL